MTAIGRTLPPSTPQPIRYSCRCYLNAFVIPTAVTIVSIAMAALYANAIYKEVTAVEEWKPIHTLLTGAVSVITGGGMGLWLITSH